MASILIRIIRSTLCVVIVGVVAAGKLVAGIFNFDYAGRSGLTRGGLFARIAGAIAAAGCAAGRAAA